ncbi:CNNM domain-containing protein [Propioniciclava soli]|uniref:CNNM domain-containing protein n=1 Tax=Propioniciclava soli TaxID=2775081 RepID=UPI001E43F2D9|nr:hemolysin family protein [Propioniciclava soli]
MTPLETSLSTGAVIALTVVIIVASAFFVATEFALMASKQHRLEERADSAAGRAALKNSSEITLLLAGSQLGITVCTLALGAITKPAVHHWLMAPLEAVGLPLVVADVVAFVLALVVVTFLHLVVGEMAPKSWAIAHPEDSSVLLALPMRAFMAVVRPLLVGMNAAANWLVRKAGAEPVDELSAGQDVAGLRELVEHSANVGALDVRYRGSLTSVLRLRDQTVREMLAEQQHFTAVSADATAADVQAATRASGHLRILVRDGDRTVGVAHVRDTLAVASDAPVRSLARTPVVVDAGAGLTAVLAELRRHRTQLAVVTESGAEVGVLSLSDILPGLMPSAMVESGVPEEGDQH